jgi:hypothetical protein
MEVQSGFAQFENFLKVNFPSVLCEIIFGYSFPRILSIEKVYERELLCYSVELGANTDFMIIKFSVSNEITNLSDPGIEWLMILPENKMDLEFTEKDFIGAFVSSIEIFGEDAQKINDRLRFVSFQDGLSDYKEGDPEEEDLQTATSFLDTIFFTNRGAFLIRISNRHNGYYPADIKISTPEILYETQI